MLPELSHGNSRPPDYSIPCPRCGPKCHTASNRKRKVVGIWQEADGSRRSWCIRCGARDRDKLSPSTLQRPAPSRERAKTRDTSQTANWLWKQSEPLKGSLGELYLCKHRGLYLVSLPATIRFLPARSRHSASMITAFGIADGTEPSDLALERDVTAVHITRLNAQGEKTGKIMLGAVSGQPLCLAPLNDGCGLAICEGIEDALSVHLATGLGAWAAGSSSHMPKLANAVPTVTECVTIVADHDEPGERSAKKLERSLRRLGFETRLTSPGATR